LFALTFVWGIGHCALPGIEIADGSAPFWQQSGGFISLLLVSAF
jgi:hypothetical protein